MSVPMDLARCLAFAPSDQAVAVSRIPFQSLRASCAERGIHEGDRLRRLGTLADHVLLLHTDGHRTLLEMRYALMLEVESAAN